MTALLFIAATVVMGLEVYFSGTATPLETALFGALEFLVVLAFSWVLARGQFRKQQEEVALLAYRRIRDIEKGVQRVLDKCDGPVSQQNGPDSRAEIIREIALGVQTDIQSSIADWATIIGEKITAYERHETVSAKPDTSEGRAKAHELPYSLQVLASREVDPRRYYVAGDLGKQLSSGHIDLTVQPVVGLAVSESKRLLGTPVSITIGDIGDRVGVLVVREPQGKAIGVVNNPYVGRLHYSEFMDALFMVMGRSHLEGRVLSYDELDGERLGRLVIRLAQPG